jgi:hypothetical protein
MCGRLGVIGQAVLMPDQGKLRVPINKGLTGYPVDLLGGALRAEPG